MVTDNDGRYNGWANYETWAVKLWIDNDQGERDYWFAQARFLMSPAGLAAHRPRLQGLVPDEHVTVWALAEQLKEVHQERTPDLGGGNVYSDLLNAALGLVEWYEIADALVEDAREVSA